MKNAGSTIAAILEREFGEAAFDLHRDADEGVIDAEDLAAFLVGTPAARAVTSHHLQYPVPLLAGIEVFDCCPIRRPLDRLESLYTFAAGDSTQYFHALASEHGIAGFLEQLIERFPNHVYNVQTVVLGNRARFHAAGAADRDAAVRTVRSSRIPVLVDRFDESLVIAEYFLSPLFPGLQLHYAPQNVTRPLGTTVAERNEALAGRLGPALTAQLRNASALDEDLCDALSEELDRRIGVIPSFERRLAEFRSRCAASTLEPATSR
jgi:hypothetical protein